MHASGLLVAVETIKRLQESKMRYGKCMDALRESCENTSRAQRGNEASTLGCHVTYREASNINSVVSASMIASGTTTKWLFVEANTDCDYRLSLSDGSIHGIMHTFRAKLDGDWPPSERISFVQRDIEAAAMERQEKLGFKTMP